MFFCACHDNDSTIADDIEISDEDELLPSINDELKVRTRLRTYVIPGDYQYSGHALVNRIQDRATVMDQTVSTFILHNNSIADLTDTDCRNIVSVVARGGNLVVCQPTSAGLKTLTLRLKETGLAMYENGELEINDVGYRACRRIMLMAGDENGDAMPDMVDNTGTDNVLFDILAIRGDQRHAVTDVGELVKDDPDNPPTENLCGILADGTAEWLDRSDNTSVRLAKGRTLLAQQANGPQAIYDNISTTDQFEYELITRAGHKRAIMKLQYDVWAVNDTQGNDYYLFQQEISCLNDQFNCVYNEPKKWTSYKVREAVLDSLKYATKPSEKILAYWPYMHDLSTNVKFSDGSASIKDISPTQIEKGSTTYTQSTHMSLNVAFLTPEVKAGLDMTKTTARNIPDIITDFKLGSDAISPQWSYTISQQPKIQRNGWNQIWYHGVALPSYYSTFIVGHSWIWKVKHNDKTFSFDTHVRLNLEALWYDKEYRKDGYYTFTNRIDVTYQLTPPSRYEQIWLMVMKERNDDDFNYMKEYVRNFDSKFSLYTVKSNDRYEIDRRIDSIVKDLSTHKDIFLERGIKPFQLRFVPNEKSDAYKVYDVDFSAMPAVKLNDSSK